jgi:hypothetical protein
MRRFYLYGFGRRLVVISLHLKAPRLMEILLLLFLSDHTRKSWVRKPRVTELPQSHAMGSQFTQVV